MSTNDDKIKNAVDEIAKQRKDLGGKPKVHLVTNGVWKDPSGAHTNINTIGTLPVCIGIVATMLTQKTMHEDAAKLLELDKSTEVKWHGYTFDEWVEDLKARAALIKWTAADKKLRHLEDKLKALRSDDAKTSDAISELMGKL